MNIECTALLPCIDSNGKSLYRTFQFPPLSISEAAAKWEKW